MQIRSEFQVISESKEELEKNDLQKFGMLISSSTQIY